jgi:GNAT superfamily N-acetyltransferase
MSKSATQTTGFTPSARADRLPARARDETRGSAFDKVFEIRPIRPADADLIVAARAYTSDDTYYRRFHAAKRYFRPEELKYLTEVDGRLHVALVAVERGEHSRLAAVARFSLDRQNPVEGEVAICVHDPFRRQGLGAEMLRRLHDEASSRGVRCLRAMVQSDNVPMRELLHHIFPDTRMAAASGPEVDYLIPVRDEGIAQAA